MTPFDRAEELLEVLVPWHTLWDGRVSDWIFRGQSDERWQLVPRALRAGELCEYDMFCTSLGSTPTATERIVAEWTVLHDFLVAADRAGLPIPEDTQAFRQIQRPTGSPVGLHTDLVRLATGGGAEWPPLFARSSLALAQHYGVPTRMLDWTWNCRIGAYFACAHIAAVDTSKRPDRFALWALLADFISTNWRGEPAGFRLVTAPQVSNPNLHAQAGVLVVHTAPNEASPFDDIIQRDLALKPVPFGPVVRKLTLPAGQAGRLLRLLAAEHVTAATLFPGHQGVVAALEERRFWRP